MERKWRKANEAKEGIMKERKNVKEAKKAKGGR